MIQKIKLLLDFNDSNAIKTIIQNDLNGVLSSLGEPIGDIREANFKIISQLIKSSSCTEIERGLIYSEVISDRFLFFGISTSDVKASVKRSFAALALVQLIIADNKSKVQVINASDLVKLVFQYLNTESDYRGFTDSNGWVHAFAHISDVIAALSYVDEINKIEVFTKTIEFLTNSKPFGFGEDQRFGRSLALLIARIDPIKMMALLDMNIYPTHSPWLLHNLRASLCSAHAYLISYEYPYATVMQKLLTIVT